jgi:hypothetical protein
MKQKLLLLVAALICAASTFSASLLSKKHAVIKAGMHASVVSHAQLNDTAFLEQLASLNRVYRTFSDSYDSYKKVVFIHGYAREIVSGGLNAGGTGIEHLVMNNHASDPYFYTYREHNIALVTQECHMGKVGLLDAWCCTLETDDHKKIDIYTHKILDPMTWYINKVFYGGETTYATSHTSCIALLVDEHGYITHILDDVKSHDDILQGFGIQKN